MLKEVNGVLSYLVPQGKEMDELDFSELYQMVGDGKLEYIPAEYVEVVTLYGNEDGREDGKIKALKYRVPTKDGVPVTFTIPFRDGLPEERMVLLGDELRKLVESIKDLEVAGDINFLSQIVNGVDEDELSCDHLMSFFNDSGDLLRELNLEGAKGKLPEETQESEAVKRMKYVASAFLLGSSEVEMKDIQFSEIIPVPAGYLTGDVENNAPTRGLFWILPPGNSAYGLSYELKGENEGDLEYQVESIEIPNSLTIQISLLLGSLPVFNKVAKHCLKEIVYHDDREQFEIDLRTLMTPML